MRNVNLYNHYIDQMQEIANAHEEWSLPDVVDAVFDFVQDQAEQEGKTFKEFVEEALM